MSSKGGIWTIPGDDGELVGAATGAGLLLTIYGRNPLVGASLAFTPEQARALRDALDDEIRGMEGGNE